MKHENCTITEGTTPTGARFEIIAGFNPHTSAITFRRLEWLQNGDVGPIGIPLRLHTPVGQLFFELTRKGNVSEQTRRAFFAC